MRPTYHNTLVKVLPGIVFVLSTAPFLFLGCRRQQQPDLGPPPPPQIAKPETTKQTGPVTVIRGGWSMTHRRTPFPSR